MCHHISQNIARIVFICSFITSLSAYGECNGNRGYTDTNIHKTSKAITASSCIPTTTTTELIKASTTPQSGSESSPFFVKNEPPTDWWLVVPTWILAFFTFTLWLATRQMVKDTISSSQNVQRAFVFVKSFEVQIIQSLRKFIIRPMWENSGDTPTKNMRNHVNWSYFDIDIPSGFDFPDIGGDERTPVLIGPHATMYATPLEFDTQVVDKVITGNGHLYIWGWAEYNDVFVGTIRHRTEFCNEVLISRISDNEITVNFRLYRLYNGAEGECIKRPIT